MKDEKPTIQSIFTIENWFLLWIEKEKKVDKDKIKLDKPLYYYGIDSIDLATLVRDYELYINKEITLNDLSNELNVNDLIKKLCLE